MKKVIVVPLLIVALLYAAANHKFLLAMAYLHDRDPNNDSEAVKLLREAAIQDKDSKSAFLLGYYYKTKKFSAVDYAKSHKYYMVAASLGDSEAKMLVAWNLYKGIGCKQDRKKAKKLLTELAIDGNKEAKEILKFVIRN